MDNYIMQYHEKITSGEIPAGKWIKKWYDKIVTGITDGDFIYAEKKAELAITFIERFCRHHEGELGGKLIKLELWQKALVSVIFGIVDSTGARQFREAVVVVARKNGKTLLAAAISAYMAFLDGEYGARIYYAAPKLEQANLCFNAFFQMIEKEPILAERAQKRRSDILVASSNTTAKPLAFSARKSDGLNVHLCVADECSSWVGEQGLRFYEVIKSSVGARRQPLILSISTAGYVNDGIYDELWKRGTAVINGGSEEKRLAPFLYSIDDPTQWKNIDELAKANPNLGVSITRGYLEDEIAIAEGSLSKRAEFLTKYANIKQNSSAAWLEGTTVKNAMQTPVDFEQFRGSYCVAGVDLSRTTDLTSACIVVEKGGTLNVISHFWMPSARLETATAEDGTPYEIMVQKGFLSLCEGSAVDYHDVYEWFTRLVEEFQIYPLQVGYDRYSATYLVDEMDKYGFHLDDVVQGFNLTPVIREVDALLKDGKINIGNNELLASHYLNSALKSNTEADKVKLVKVGTRTRIDGMAAFLDAMCVRQKWNSEIGEQLKNED